MCPQESRRPNVACESELYQISRKWPRGRTQRERDARIFCLPRVNISTGALPFWQSPPFSFALPTRSTCLFSYATRQRDSRGLFRGSSKFRRIPDRPVFEAISHLADDRRVFRVTGQLASRRNSQGIDERSSEVSGVSVSKENLDAKRKLGTLKNADIALHDASRILSNCVTKFLRTCLLRFFRISKLWLGTTRDTVYLSYFFPWK